MQLSVSASEFELREIERRVSASECEAGKWTGA
jgi:hypothetical protein